MGRLSPGQLIYKLTTVFDDNASYIGTGDGEICYSLEQVRAAYLKETFSVSGRPFTMGNVCV